MKHPDKKQFNTVIKNLKKAQRMAEGNAPVNMCKGDIENTEHFCGTPLCHGGWYAIAVFKKLKGKDFTNGAARMAKHLGFENDDELENWAEENPELWGNDQGNAMFIHASAFNGIKDRNNFTLQTIIDHWKGVRDRVLQLN